jgi:serine/threonine-protein kinase
VEAAVFTALEKLPADRFGTAAEFAAALANPTTTTARTSVQPAVVAKRKNWLAAGGFALAALAIGVVIGGRTRNVGSVGHNEVVKASLALGDSAVVRSISNARLAIAPSGRRIAFVGADGTDNALWVRELDQPTARILPDTKGAFAPFFSPDGESIGFFISAGGGAAIKVIPAAGGVARTVVPDSVAPFGGGDWGDNDQIVFTHIDRGLARVSSTGGAITHISHPDSSAGVQEHDYPDVLPGSKSALVMIWLGSIGSNHIGLVDLSTGAVTDLTAGSYARYAAPGYLVIGASDGRLLAAPFDARRGKLGGTPALMLDNVQAEGTNGTVQFAASQTGVLIYQPTTGGSGGLAWVDRAGKATPIDTTLKQVGLDASLSPDASEIVLTRSESGDNQVWIKQLATGTLSRISFDVDNADRPVWAPDGRRVAYLGTRNNRRTGWIRRADGSDSAKAAYPGTMEADEIAFDPHMQYTLLRSEGAGSGSRHLFVVKNGVDTVPRPLIQSRFDNFAMTLSPDGQWLAYVSLESGKPEVYVRPFPGVDSARFVISVGGGQEPVWSRDGRELFFRSPRGEMYAVPVTTGRVFSHGVPKLLFVGTGFAIQDFHRSYDVHPDGKRFLMVAAGGADAHSVNVIFNWRVELEKLGKMTK